MRFQVAPHVFWMCHKSQSLLGPYHPKYTRRHHNTLWIAAVEVGPLPVLPGNRGTPRRHLQYQVEDFSSTREEYLEKIKRQTEEIVHMRAQLALQSGPGNSLLCHIGTKSEALRSVSNQVATVLACVHANGPVGELLFPNVQGIQLPLDNLVHCLSVKAGSGNKTSFRDFFLRTILQRAIRPPGMPPTRLSRTRSPGT
ncbi:hypothetical protein UPYG_G00325610 [Umbra pygmaea]|uniref:Uncharacterized protein n=1 Tax=Umbra pygmaea TaxID=75934 RepID=A0ABD0WJY2_UMBPY